MLKLLMAYFALGGNYFRFSLGTIIRFDIIKDYRPIFKVGLLKIFEKKGGEKLENS
jgi:hypothetical protein